MVDFFILNHIIYNKKLWQLQKKKLKELKY